MIYLNFFLIIILNLLSIFSLKARIVEGIVGGNDAHINQFKYHVSILDGNKVICGGGIIGLQHILTAAQCVINERNQFIDKKFMILAGVIDLNPQNPNRILIPVERAYVPTEYQKMSSSRKNIERLEKLDVAILKLTEKLPVDESYVLKLPEKRSGRFLKHLNDNAIITGFGRNTIVYYRNDKEIKKELESEQASSSVIKKLQFAKTTLIHTNSCRKKWLPAVITDAHICAHVEQPNNIVAGGVCMGDEGGPLVFEENTVIGVLIKVRYTCNERWSAGLYTYVAEVKDFISKAMDDDSAVNIRVAYYHGEHVQEGIRALYTSNSK